MRPHQAGCRQNFQPVGGDYTRMPSSLGSPHPQRRSWTSSAPPAPGRGIARRQMGIGVSTARLSLGSTKQRLQDHVAIASPFAAAEAVGSPGATLPVHGHR